MANGLCSPTLKLESLLFDIDGVIVDREEAINTSWKIWKISLMKHIPQISQSELPKIIEFIRSGKAKDTVTQFLHQ
ncbi:MAG: hypothetical protein QMD14_05680, partial [Candidatus Aenigmarchaeota archaeon]|nr:hypothetical protein [Candidatus Aenigmarchaeota archaeon]